MIITLAKGKAGLHDFTAVTTAIFAVPTRSNQGV
jgi:hypothetical protein